MSPFSDFERLSLLIDTSLGRTLLIADPHIGFELSRGLRIRTGLEESLAEFILARDPDLLVILGDVKEPLGLSFRLKEMLLRFFSELGDVSVLLAKGNHDGRIEEVAKNFSNVEVGEYFLIDGRIFLHGHTKLPEVDFEEAFLGHAHPAYTIKSGGVARKVKVFARTGKFLILPTVNPYIEGFDVKEGLRLIPFLRKARDVELFLPEGLYLGRLKL